MVYFFYGENEFELNRAVAKLRDEFLHENPADSVAKFDMTETEPDRIFAEIINVNLFAPRRFFVIKDVFANKLFVEKLSEFLSRIPAENEVILVDQKPDKRTKIFKDLVAKTTAREFKILREWELQKWLADEVDSRKVAMDAAAQGELLNLVSGEENPQPRIAMELDKFANLNCEITIEEVREMVEPNLAADTFAIFAMAVRGERENLAREIAKLKSSGENSNQLFGLIGSQLFALAVAKTAGTGGDVAKQFKIHPFQLGKMSSLAREISAADIENFARILAAADAKMKLSDENAAWRILEIALAKITKIAKN